MTDQIFDGAAFDKLTANDVSLQGELLVLFQAHQPMLIEEAKSGERGTFSHKLRGIAANLTAPRLAAFAARWGDMEDWVVDDEMSTLRDELSQLEAAIAAHLKAQ
ncbi:MAG: hypothetical protein AAGH82_03180 [Pseudomonadota bacterium]